MITENLSSLIKMSQKYGSNSDYVLAGGGNTSYKNSKNLFIKGSGVALSVIETEGFVKMSRKALDKMFEKDYGKDEVQREAMVLADLMAAKEKGEEAKRPSVETMLHNLFSQKYVLHVHPAFVNFLTCSKNGEKEMEKMFPEAIWVPACKPGYILAAFCKQAMDKYKAKNGKDADILFLENHGIFFAANSVSAIDALVKKVKTTFAQKVTVANLKENTGNTLKASAVAPYIRMAYMAAVGGESAVASYFAPAVLFDYIKSEKDFDIFSYPPTPDHIVYCKAKPLFVAESDDPALAIKNAFDKFVKANGYAPKIIALENLGAFACGATIKEALTAKQLFIDELKVVSGTSAFGGYKPMTKELTDFIVNWEVESYRSKTSLAKGSAKRLSDKISLVTGSAQGFGKGLAEKLAEEGAYVVIADMNEKGAQEVADELCEKFGAGKAIAVGANVSDEASVEAMFAKAALYYGGLDIYVNNAGIVRSGDLEAMTKQSFELVTAVNYTAYFLCAKYASRIMKAQNAICPDYMADIIEINSKSGLSGSNKNFAYAGSKFGGLGLTQSFAMELAPYKIKVNAICPGNFLNGPLWSDPERGLFVQYLKAGKVPGAKTIDDVRKFYEAKVPLGRGCEPEDVSRAMLYIIEQKYETGQAIPVTGGQEMLK